MENKKFEIRQFWKDNHGYKHQIMDIDPEKDNQVTTYCYNKKWLLVFNKEGYEVYLGAYLTCNYLAELWQEHEELNVKKLSIDEFEIGQLWLDNDGHVHQIMDVDYAFQRIDTYGCYGTFQPRAFTFDKNGKSKACETRLVKLHNKQMKDLQTEEPQTAETPNRVFEVGQKWIDNEKRVHSILAIHKASIFTVGIFDEWNEKPSYYCFDINGENGLDSSNEGEKVRLLKPWPEQKAGEVFINVHTTEIKDHFDYNLYDTLEEAKENAESDCIARVKVQWKEGQFDE